MDDYDLIEASFLSQYGIRLKTAELDFDEFLNLTIIELSADEFKSKYMKMISETESIYDKSEKLIKNLK